MKNSKARALCRLALLCALAVALSTLEGIFTPLLPPGAKAGLSNIIVMLAAMTAGLPATLAVVLFKSVFALIMRGTVSAFLSFAGGLGSFGNQTAQSVAQAVCLGIILRATGSVAAGTAGVSDDG